MSLIGLNGLVGSGDFSAPYDYELEFVETPQKGAWVDTGIKASNNIDIYVKWSVTSNAGTAMLYGTELQTRSATAHMFGGWRWGAAMLKPVISFGVHEASLVTDMGGTSVLSVDGRYADFTNAVDFTSPNTIHVFTLGASPSQYTLGGRLYYFRIDRDGAPVIDWIPVAKDGRAGLYNRVDGTITYSSSGVDWQFPR